MRRARVRFRRAVVSRNVSPGTTLAYREGDEAILLQFDGEYGWWWTDTDIDGAYIFPADAVEIVWILEPKPYNVMPTLDK